MRTYTSCTDQNCTIKSLLRAITLTLAIAAAAATPAAAQVFEGDLELTTQTQVDDFAFTQVTGSLVIQDDGSDPITNLDGLSSLTSVGLNLNVIDNALLTDVDGLNSLTSVRATMLFRNNASLGDVDGLISLNMVGRFFFVDNTSLTNVDGLSNLTQGGPGLSIEFVRNDSLTNVDGLIGITSVRGNLVIFDNQSLTNLDGLSNITSVEIVLLIANNPVLTDLEGLSGITSVGLAPDFGFMHINNNDSLTDLDGLRNLTSVGGDLSIRGNLSLTDMDGLISLTSVEGNLTIKDNYSLTRFCGLFPLLAADGLAGGYFVSGNDINPTEQDILDGGPCNPADKIFDLLTEGAINEGMAMALLNVADKSLEGLAGLLMGFVQSGILTPAEAQLLFVIASI